MAIVLAADSKYPQILDDTAPFVYARLMGSSPEHESGYADHELDQWATRARAWARNGREVFLYFISGHKQKNPAAAMALIERLE